MVAFNQIEIPGRVLEIGAHHFRAVAEPVGHIYPEAAFPHLAIEQRRVRSEYELPYDETPFVIEVSMEIARDVSNTLELKIGTRVFEVRGFHGKADKKPPFEASWTLTLRAINQPE